MSDLPATIRSPETFLAKPSAGFDGVFDWSWTEGCFGKTSITPMDFDGVVERKGNFLLFETKENGTPLPRGQEITLESALQTGHFTIVLIWGKTRPERFELWAPLSEKRRGFEGMEKAREVVSRWYEWADKNPKNRIDISFLNRKIQQLQTENERLAESIRGAITLLTGALDEK